MKTTPLTFAFFVPSSEVIGLCIFDLLFYFLVEIDKPHCTFEEDGSSCNVSCLCSKGAWFESSPDTEYSVWFHSFSPRRFQDKTLNVPRLFLGAFLKLWEAPISFVISVCLSVRLFAWNISASTVWILIKFDVRVFS
jgi:hypothetical protein